MFALDPQLANDTIVIGDLELSRVLLMNDKNYPWIILVPRIEQAVEVFQLSESQQRELTAESALIAQVMYRHFSADKMNVAALGNVVAQLHVHHIVRFKSDLCWPKPVWGVCAPVQYTRGESAAMVDTLRVLLTPMGLLL